MATHVYIAGIDYGDKVLFDGLSIEQVLTQAVDICSFRVRDVQPHEGEEVRIEDDTVGLLFAGIIDNVRLVRDEEVVKIWEVRGQDYTYLLDRRLVVETYENMTADAIVRDIIAKYGGGVFTTNHVQSGAPVVELIVFDYKRPSECLKELADYVGWDWYVDYDKDIWFFDPKTLNQPAPMALEAGAKFRNLKHTIDQQGLRNRVYVRGGTMLSDPWTYEVQADGSARAWVLPHKPHDLTVKVGGEVKTVGIENVHEESQYDFLMNFQEKYVRCSAQTPTPAAGTTLSFTYRYDIDVITMVEDLASQQAIAAVQGGDGVYEHVIVDDSLTTIDAAEAAGMADLREHANPRVKGSFETEVPDWAPGQLVTINLPDRGIQGTFLVQKVTIVPTTPELWTYRVEYGGRLLGIADWLQALWKAQQKKKLNETALLHKFHYRAETCGIVDEIGPTIIHRIPAIVLPKPAFSRSSVAYKSDGTQVAANVPRFEPGRFGQAVLVEEGTENIHHEKLYRSLSASYLKVTDVERDGFTRCKRFERIAEGSAYFTVDIPCLPNTAYTLTFWIRGVNLSPDSYVSMYLSDDTQSPEHHYIYGLTDEFKKFTVTRITSESATKIVRASLHFGYNSIKVGEIIEVADWQLEAKPYATSFTDSIRSPETLTIPTAGVLNPQEGTVECWVYINDIVWATKPLRIWSIPTSTGLASDALAIYHGTANEWGFIVDNKSYSNFGSLIPSIGWVHFAFTWKMGEYVKVYINGVLAREITGVNIPNFGSVMAIGSRADNTRHCNTLIDDLRISSRARTDAEIAAAYASNAPLPVDEWTAYKLNFDNEIMDYVRTPLCGFVMCSA